MILLRAPIYCQLSKELYDIIRFYIKISENSLLDIYADPGVIILKPEMSPSQDFEVVEPPTRRNFTVEKSIPPVAKTKF